MKFKRFVIAVTIGTGILGSVIYSSASAATLETKKVELENVSQDGKDVHAAGIGNVAQKAWVYGTEAAKHYGGKALNMFFDNGGFSINHEPDKDINNVDVIFDKK
ncbi:hypothetical protein KY305_01705 [Bacillus sp. YC2]|uniref:hypothetical protein n=1 Tax=Bacillus sp. YC2 TaxID=2861287 RepID=UPI001CA62F72|nr:hypothetical protein [Bacillus sp. YC2]MBY8911473.1 hypothetical protein [Bacillus sp. YC2]